MEDIALIPGASGGAKWLVLGGIDRYLFGDLLRGPRETPIHLLGSSIGSWRMACAAQRDPIAAFARGHHGYIYDQSYSHRPSPVEVTQVLRGILAHMLGDHGARDAVLHAGYRIHVVTARGRGLAAGHRPWLRTALGAAAVCNAINRRSLHWFFERTVFHNADATPLLNVGDLPTQLRSLTSDNFTQVLLASGSIPLLMEGVELQGQGAHWDGGVIDYHLDLDFGIRDGIVLYPHFYDYVVPGWLDKGLPWRRANERNFDRAVLVAPSSEFVRSLPGGKIPDRRDFYALAPEVRQQRWQGVLDASAALGDALRELVETGRIAEVVRPWTEG